jgi:hypothetical protein
MPSDVRWLLGRAAALGVLFVVFAVLGGREAALVLSGTGPHGLFSLLVGVGYVSSWLAGLTVAVPFAIAGALLLGWDLLASTVAPTPRRERPRRGDDAAASDTVSEV